MMKFSEKTKTEDVIKRIQSGSFDALDVDSLFSKLREYAPRDSVFKEIAHYLAHNREREQGLTRQALYSFQLNLQFITEYLLPKKQLDIYNLPLWIKELMIFQTYKADEKSFREKYNMSADRIRKRIESRFKDDKKNKVTRYKKQQITTEDSSIFSDLLGVLHAQNAFTPKNVFDDLFDILDKLNLTFDKDALLINKDKITLCIIHIINGTEFSLNNGSKAICVIADDFEDRKARRKSGIKNFDIDEKGKPIPSEEDEDYFELGNLCILGQVEVNYKGKDLTMSFPILSTDLDIRKWVHPSLMEVRKGDYQYISVDMSQDMIINENFKLATDRECLNFEDIEDFIQHNI